MHLSLCIVLVIIVVLLLSVSCNEAFNGGPADHDKKRIVETALANKNVFDKHAGSFAKAKSIISGIDNVTYEDFRVLNNNGQFTQSKLMSVLS